MATQFKGKRNILNRTITIDATPDAIFPLLCPVRETEWVDGWIGNAVFSKSGYAEENGVFSTEHDGEDDTIWFVTKRDAAAHEIEFVYFVPRIQVVRLVVRLAPLSADETALSVEYIRTGISDAGNDVIEKSDSHFDAMMTAWEASMNHYIKTGELLKEVH